MTNRNGANTTMNDPAHPRDIENLLIPHQPFQYGIERLEWALAEGGIAAEPVCVPVIGESRTGKSRLLEHIAGQFPVKRSNDGLHIPILCARVPATPTVKGMAEILLRRIGDPLFHRGTEQEKSARLERLLQECSTQMIGLDEFNHFVDKSTARVQLAVSDWLKTLADNTGVSLALFGLPYSQAVIDQNEQLQGRCTRAVVLPRFDWSNNLSQQEFLKILRCLDRYLKGWSLPDVKRKTMAFRLYCASGGLIGYVIRILRFAMDEAHNRGDTHVHMDDLARGYSNAIWDAEGADNLVGVFDPDTDFRVSRARLEGAHKVGRPGRVADSHERRGRTQSRSAVKALSA